MFHQSFLFLNHNHKSKGRYDVSPRFENNDELKRIRMEEQEEHKQEKIQNKEKTSKANKRNKKDKREDKQ